MDKLLHKHLYVETRIQESIKHREVDEKIPGERVFAKDLGVSYMTARKAVDSLVAKGVLYRIPKKGTYVADRSVIQNKTKNIGYFLDNSIRGGLASPYYSVIFDAIEKEATKNGYGLIYFSDICESNVIQRMEKIDGVIISCFPRLESIVRNISALTPVICVDNCSADKSIPSVTIDNFHAVVESVDYLFSLGHTRIGFITGLDDSDVGKDRFAGYISALNSHGIDEDIDLVFKGDYSFDTGSNGADYFLSLDRQPTAIVCANDSMAIGAIKAISQRGLLVPDDISVIGFDDIPVAAQMTPSLTTVSAPVERIAKESVNMLNSILYGHDLEHRHISLPGKLVLRNSCAAINNSSHTARKLKKY